MAHMRNALKRLHLDIFPFFKETMFLKAFVLQRITYLTDYGHTMAKSLILCGPNSNPNPKSIFGIWL